MIARLGVAAVAAALVLSASPAHAQAANPAAISLFAPAPQPAAAPRSAQPGPTLDAASVAVRPQLPAADRTASDLMAGTSRTQSRAMMIVGGAALIVGAVIGGTPGTIVMVGGAVVGLLGLYEYVQ